MIEKDRPVIPLGLGQVDTVTRWALRDAIHNLETLQTREGLEDYSQANLDGLRVAYAYFGGEAEGDLV